VVFLVEMRSPDESVSGRCLSPSAEPFLLRINSGLTARVNVSEMGRKGNEAGRQWLNFSADWGPLEARLSFGRWRGERSKTSVNASCRKAIGARSVKIKLDDFLLFNHQLAALIHAGLPVLQSIQMLGQRSPNPKLRMVLRAV